jgi:hypothetical protein
MRRVLNAVAAGALALMVGLIIGGAINSAATDTASAEVYGACTTGTMQDCYKLQTKFNIEFLCNSSNTQCWTEAK